MITIEQKFTVWKRITIDGDNKESLAHFLKKNRHATYSELYDWVAEGGVGNSNLTEELLIDTECYMTPASNGGFTALKIWQDGEMVHTR